MCLQLRKDVELLVLQALAWGGRWGGARCCGGGALEQREEEWLQWSKHGCFWCFWPTGPPELAWSTPRPGKASNQRKGGWRPDISPSSFSEVISRCAT